MHASYAEEATEVDFSCFRAAEARRIVANQRGLIAMLKAKGERTVEAEGVLEVYLSSLKVLEDHEWKIRQERKAKKGETKKSRSN